MSPSVVVATTPLQNFVLHLISEPPLGVSIDDCKPLGSLHEPVGVFSSTFLVHFTQFFACWYLSHAYDHVLVMLKVFASCVLGVFAMKASVALTHRVTFIVTQVSLQSINDQSRLSDLSLAPSVSHVEHVCLDVLSRFVIESCECVFA